MYNQGKIATEASTREKTQTPILWLVSDQSRIACACFLSTTPARDVSPIDAFRPPVWQGSERAKSGITRKRYLRDLLPTGLMIGRENLAQLKIPSPPSRRLLGLKFGTGLGCAAEGGGPGFRIGCLTFLASFCADQSAIWRG
jgi:hypothetical protein